MINIGPDVKLIQYFFFFQNQDLPCERYSLIWWASNFKSDPKWGPYGFFFRFKGWAMVVVFNTTFNNISVISWQSVLLVKELGENHWPSASHWQILSHNAVHLAWAGFKLITLVPIGTTNYHTITTTTTPFRFFYKKKERKKVRYDSKYND
jgi:hypothetical protein